MPDILFIGEGMEIQPYRLLGVETFSPAGPVEDVSWVEAVARGGYDLIFVSEGLLCARAGAVEALHRALDARTALTIVPDPDRMQSGHLRFLRRQTARALGVDTWNTERDHAGDGA